MSVVNMLSRRCKKTAVICLTSFNNISKRGTQNIEAVIREPTRAFVFVSLFSKIKSQYNEKFMLVCLSTVT